MGSVANFFSRLFGRGATVGEGDIVATIPKGYYTGSSSGYSLGGQSSGSKWDYGLSTDGASPTIDHQRVRQNSRSAYLDSLQCHAIVNRFTDTVVDTGLKLKPNPVASILGLPAEQLSQWAKEVEERFDLWAGSKKCHRSEQMNFYQIQRQAEMYQQRDGEYFVRLTYNDRKDLTNPLQLRFIDPSQIVDDVFTSTSGMEFTSQGIQRDSAGRETSYKIYALRGNTYEYFTIPAKGPRSGKRIMVHGFCTEWPNQVRGYPRVMHALQEFENMTDFTLSHIKKAINQSMLTAFVKPSDDAPASNPFAEISHNVTGPMDTTLGTGATAPAGDLSDSTSVENHMRFIPIQEAGSAVPGSMIVASLESGEELQPFKDTAPVTEFGKFVDSFAGHLSASMSIPLEVVLMKFNQNYSASRAALILFWRIAQIWRQELAIDFLKPVYEEWLAGEIAAGTVQAPGWSDVRMREAWLNCHWSGVPMPNIDPEKTARADQLYIDMGAQTLQHVAQDLNGSNVEANKMKIARELEGLPVTPWSDIAKKEASKNGE